jgi:hypothetical protein
VWLSARALAIKFLEKRTLKHRIVENLLKTETVLALTIQVADALEGLQRESVALRPDPPCFCRVPLIYQQLPLSLPTQLALSQAN